MLCKEEKYQMLLRQIGKLVSESDDLVSNLSNAVAALKEAFGFFWVGFYIVKGDHLALYPFQGPVACTRIPFGRGVCGTAWKERAAQIVPDVHLFPGHIACNEASRSEIVVPVVRRGDVVAVLDIDSDSPDSFDETDRVYLEKICALPHLWP